MLALILNPHRGLYLINCSRMKKNSLKEIITWRQWSWWLKLESSQRVLQSTVWTKIKENSNENKRGKKLSCVWCVLTWSGRDFFSPLCSLLWSSAAALLWLFFLPSLVISLSLCVSLFRSLFSAVFWKTQVSCDMQESCVTKANPSLILHPPIPTSPLAPPLSPIEAAVSIKCTKRSSLSAGVWPLRPLQSHDLCSNYRALQHLVYCP